MSGVTVIDRGANAMLRRAHEMARGRVVRVGILDDAAKAAEPGAKPPPYTLVQVAAVHEFGGGHVPQRSFLRSTVDERRAEILDRQKKLAVQVLEGKVAPEVALERLGFVIVGWVQAKITSNIPPALAESTLRRKTVGGKVGNVALVNTGQLRSAIVSRVVDG